MSKKGLVIGLVILVSLIMLSGQVFAGERGEGQGMGKSFLVAQHEETEPPATEVQESGKEVGHPGGGVGAKGWLAVFSALAAAIGIGIATIGPGLGQGKAVASAMEAIGRNPEAQSKLFVPLIIGLAFMEALTIYALVISLALVFFNPLMNFLK